MKLKNITAIMTVLYIFAGIAFSAEQGKSGSPGLTAEEIMKKVDGNEEPSDMMSEMTMTLVDRNGKERVRRVLTARKGKKSTIMWFLGPADLKGSSFLSIEEKGVTNMWIYLPALGKVTAITSHSKQRKGYFMGSDFTYEDLEGRKVGDYDYKLLGSETIDGRDCYVVSSVPKPELKEPSYGKIVSWVWKENFFSLKEEYYDRMNNLAKVQSITGLKKKGKYFLPENLVMENVQERTKHKTRIDFADIRIDTGIDDGIFHQRSLTRIFNRDALYKKGEEGK